MTRTRVRLVALAATVLFATVSCRELPSHDENGPSAYIDILAVGDSYTAGNNATSDGSDGYYNSDKSPDDPRNISLVRQRPTTSPSDPDPDRGCYRNHNNYSEVLYRLLGSSGAYVNAACTGDITENITGTNGNPPQIDGFTPEQRAEVDLITLSIGGNDLGFASMLVHCYLVPFGPSCDADFDAAEAMMDSPGQYSVIQARMLAALNKLKNEFPGTKIVLVGYPLFSEEDEASIPCPGCGGAIYPGQRLEAGLNLLNAEQQELIDNLNISSSGRFGFLPLHTQNNDGIYDGHGISGSAEPWIRSPGSSVYRHEWFHPSAAGHAATAQELYQLPVVQQLLNDRIRADYPKMSLTKVDDQWYALDSTGKLWKVTADFARCQQPNGQYKLISWKNPSQVFDAATNAAPYPDLPGQPGCNLSVPRAGDILDGSLGSGWSPYDYENSWVISYGPNGEKYRTRIWWHDGDPNHVPSANCFAGRGAKVFTVPAQALEEYQDTGGVVYDDDCSWTIGAAYDDHGNLWLHRTRGAPQYSASDGATYAYTLTLITDPWMLDCWQNPPPGLDYVGWRIAPGHYSDERIEGARQLGLLRYDGYEDARCIR
ncbi:MAG TPA: SGNH/GDSL hydrolase family protein [Verrucomicrobiae bacterium]|nr:SGNH/GDSL hydrolase family protein [Verrucomicrobiae bacterium]